MAQHSGRRASEFVGIGCEVCAYVFDDALLFRQQLELSKAQEPSEEEEMQMNAALQKQRIEKAQIEMAGRRRA